MTYAQSQVQEALVVYKISDEDQALVSQYTWYLTSHGYMATRAKQNSPVGKPKQLIYMHRLIMGLPEQEIDHINRDKLDNRRENLRLADRVIQTNNCNISKNNKSGINGVSFSKHRQKWIAYRGNLRKAGFPTKEAAEEWLRDISGGGTCGV
jgi:hypothetical protein